MARRKPAETSAVAALTPEDLQKVYDGALTTLGQTCVHPDIAAARQRMQADLMRKLNVSKADVIMMFMDAVQDAKFLADPKAQIAGARELGLMLGYYESVKVEVNHTGTLRVVREQLKQATDEELQKMIGEEILDADFYPVSNRG